MGFDDEPDMHQPRKFHVHVSFWYNCHEQGEDIRAPHSLVDQTRDVRPISAATNVLA